MRALIATATLLLAAQLATPAVAEDAADAAAATSPVTVVQSAADELLEGLSGRRDELRENKSELYELIDGILASRFDRRYAAQLVLARHWRGADEAQRDRFIDAFYGSLLRKYADGVLEFNDERLTILPYRGDSESRRTTVRTEVYLDDGSSVPVNYGLVKRSDGWKVYDVTIEGISYIRNFRTEMNAEINARGLDAVIERLEGGAAASEG